MIYAVAMKQLQAMFVSLWCVCVSKAVFEVTLRTPQHLSVDELISTHNTSTRITISPATTRYVQVSFTFVFAW